MDGFTNWCKQVIGICLTAFLQATMLIAGLMVLSKNAPSGTGDHAGGRGGAEDCRTVWAGYQYQGEPDEQCVCSPERGKPDQDHCTGSGEIGGTDWRPG